MTRAELERDYATKEGIIRSPGKFEGEPIWAPYFYDRGLDGFADLDTGGEDEGTMPLWAFLVDATDAQQFPELLDVYAVSLEESDTGFVYTSTLTREEFEKLGA